MKGRAFGHRADEPTEVGRSPSSLGHHTERAGVAEARAELTVERLRLLTAGAGRRMGIAAVLCILLWLGFFWATA